MSLAKLKVYKFKISSTETTNPKQKKALYNPIQSFLF